MIPAEPPDRPLDQFGIRLGGHGLLLPAGVPAVYLESVAVNALPGAPDGVLGLMQLQGYPIPVLDPFPELPLPDERPLRVALLVLGEPQRGAGLRLVAPPQAVSVRATGDIQPPVGCLFAPALHSPMVDDLDPDQVWWHVDLPSLFRCLAGGRAPS